MAKKTLQNLAKSYEVDDFCEYITETWINGNKESAVELFKEMKPKDQAHFMNELNNCTFQKDGPWQMDLLKRLIYVVIQF